MEYGPQAIPLPPPPPPMPLPPAAPAPAPAPAPIPARIPAKNDRVRVADPLSDLPDQSNMDADDLSDVEGSQARNKHLFNRDWFSDASVMAGPDARRRLIPIHTQILAPASAPLAAMFGSQWNKDSGPVRIRDFEATVVLSALRWVYCDELYYLQEDWEELLQFATLYLMKPLVSALVKQATVKSDTIWDMISAAVRQDCQALLKKCYDFIFVNSKSLLDSPDFLQQPVEVVTAITQMDQLTVSEYELFAHCHAWAVEECLRNKRNPTPGYLRSLMEPFLKNIAFTVINYNDLPLIRDTGILTNEERLSVYDAIGDKSSSSVFPKKRRWVQVWCVKCQQMLDDLLSLAGPSGHAATGNSSYQFTAPVDESADLAALRASRPFLTFEMVRDLHSLRESLKTEGIRCFDAFQSSLLSIFDGNKQSYRQTMYPSQPMMMGLPGPMDVQHTMGPYARGGGGGGGGGVTASVSSHLTVFCRQRLDQIANEYGLGPLPPPNAGPIVGPNYGARAPGPRSITISL